jgi:predicted transport protein
MRYKYLLIFLLSLFLYAMGTTDNVVTKIPSPDRFFKVKIIDTEENEIIADNFSVTGLTYLPAEIGKTEVSIDFKKIEKILFFNQDKKLKIKIKFTNGEVSDFTMKKDIVFFGRTGWGNLKIKSKDIKQLIFIN